MKARILLCVCVLTISSCAGYDVGFGLGTEVDGKPVRVDFNVRRTGKEPRNVQPVRFADKEVQPVQ